jgi:hypothetical protein
MNRGTGTGLIAFGVVLGVVGAVMAFAITVTTPGFNINTAGWILLVVGIIVLRNRRHPRNCSYRVGNHLLHEASLNEDDLA